MRKLLLLSAFISTGLFAQTTHTVLVGGSTLGPVAPYYNPQNLTIDVGDIVLWQNQSGTHNVTGTTDIFPANPEGFASGEPQSGNWTFQHTFTIAGTYNYHCTQQGHSATQFGSIVVLPPQNVQETGASDDIILFPVPATDVIVVDLGRQQMLSVEVIGVDGRVHVQRPLTGASRVELPIADLPGGQYYVRLISEKQHTLVRPFRKS